MKLFFSAYSFRLQLLHSGQMPPPWTYATMKVHGIRFSVIKLNIFLPTVPEHSGQIPRHVNLLSIATMKAPKVTLNSVSQSIFLFGIII